MRGLCALTTEPHNHLQVWAIRILTAQTRTCPLLGSAGPSDTADPMLWRAVARSLRVPASSTSAYLHLSVPASVGKALKATVPTTALLSVWQYRPPAAAVPFSTATRPGKPKKGEQKVSALSAFLQGALNETRPTLPTAQRNTAPTHPWRGSQASASVNAAQLASDVLLRELQRTKGIVALHKVMVQNRARLSSHHLRQGWLKLSGALQLAKHEIEGCACAMSVFIMIEPYLSEYVHDRHSLEPVTYVYGNLAYIQTLVYVTLKHNIGGWRCEGSSTVRAHGTRAR